MSYDVYLNDPVSKEPIILAEPHHMIGGRMQVGGSTEAHLNITYNYARHYYGTMGQEGIRGIYGKTGAESIPLLEGAAAKLGDDLDDDYWKATEGNAKRALLSLLALARMHPDGIWGGD